MDCKWKEMFRKHTLAFIAGGVFLCIALAGIGSVGFAYSGTAAFCGGVCHSMKSEAATFAESSHSSLDCVECHLPHDNMAIYVFEKGRTGMVDTYHEVLKDYPAHIKISADGKQTVNGNCLRCHEDTLENVHVAIGESQDTGADCMKCHSNIAHGSNHLEGGIRVE